MKQGWKDAIHSFFFKFPQYKETINEIPQHILSKFHKLPYRLHETQWHVESGFLFHPSGLMFPSELKNEFNYRQPIFLFLNKTIDKK